MDASGWSELNLRDDIRRLRNDLASLRNAAFESGGPLVTAGGLDDGGGPDRVSAGCRPEAVQARVEDLIRDPGRIIHSPEPSVALVIATFAAVPYVHVALESWRRHYPHVPVLVHDDGSPLAGDIQRLCGDYGVGFSCNPRRMRHFVGDISAYARGLEWATARGADLLVKMSRRFIPVSNWVPGFQRLAWDTQYATYSQRCRAVGFGFRTECIGFHVPTWKNSPAYVDLRERTLRDEPVFVEAHVHNLARDLHRSSCEANRLYETTHPRPSDADAYGVWGIMPESRGIRSTEVLWHNCNSAADYAHVAAQYSLPYGPGDFQDPNQGYGPGEH